MTRLTKMIVVTPRASDAWPIGSKPSRENFLTIRRAKAHKPRPQLGNGSVLSYSPTVGRASPTNRSREQLHFDLRPGRPSLLSGQISCPAIAAGHVVETTIPAGFESIGCLPPSWHKMATAPAESFDAWVKARGAAGRMSKNVHVPMFAKCDSETCSLVWQVTFLRFSWSILGCHIILHRFCGREKSSTLIELDSEKTPLQPARLQDRNMWDHLQAPLLQMQAFCRAVAGSGRSCELGNVKKLEKNTPLPHCLTALR